MIISERFKSNGKNLMKILEIYLKIIIDKEKIEII